MTLPGTAPSVRQHVPQPRSVTLNVGGRDAIEHLARLQPAVVNDYHSYRRSIPPGVAPDELRDNAGSYAITDQALSLKPGLDAAEALRDAATKDLVDSTKPPDIPQEQSGAAVAIWTRAEKRADKAKSPGQKAQVLRDLIADAPPGSLELKVYQREIPFYARTEGLPTDWLAAAFAAQMPEVAAKAQRARDVTQYHTVLQHNHQKIMRAIEKDTDVPPLLDPYAISTAPYSDGTGPATSNPTGP